MQKVLANMNVQHMITEQEMRTIFKEFGSERFIAGDQLLKIL
jgi:hypothetical protein